MSPPCLRPRRLCRSSAWLWLALASAGPTAAQTPIRLLPGLWEHSIAIQDNGGQAAGVMKELQAQLARMTPEQRQQLEAMMAGKGIALNSAADNAGSPTTAVRMCMTQAQLDLNESPQLEKNCSQQSTQRSGNTFRFKFSCSGTPPATGDGEIQVLSETAYRGSTRVETVINGKPGQLSMAQTGKWLSADCGSVKPAAPMPPPKK